MAVRELKRTSGHDLIVGGPHLAAEALRAGLVDECHQFLNPIVIGSGNHWLPAGLRFELELADERALPNGVVYLRYRVPRGES